MQWSDDQESRQTDQEHDEQLIILIDALCEQLLDTYEIDHFGKTIRELTSSV